MKIELFGLEGIPEIRAGDDLANVISEAARRGTSALERGDIVVVTQKVVSKAEGRVVFLADVRPSALATRWAEQNGGDARVIELVLAESRRIVRMDRGVLIVETRQGFVCANAGVDLSNVSGGTSATLLPIDPDASAARLRVELLAKTGCEVAVIISDTFGRPFREGLVEVAIGTSGIAPLESYVGARDPLGFPLRATVIARADEVAAAAGLVATKLNRTPVVLVRGLRYEPGGSARDMIRARESDLFR